MDFGILCPVSVTFSPQRSFKDLYRISYTSSFHTCDMSGPSSGDVARSPSGAQRDAAAGGPPAAERDGGAKPSGVQRPRQGVDSIGT